MTDLKRSDQLIIQKFGGSSVSSLSRLQRVAGIIRDSIEGGSSVVAVVSAMGNETSRLDAMAREMGVASGVELDVLLSSGEQASAALLAMALNQLGVKAASFCGHQVRFLTSSDHQNAWVESVEVENLQQALAQQVVPVIAGFQGVDSHGAITTFGRGGSDLTAVALGAALQASECQIYSDTDGVYTADPRIVPSAQKHLRIAMPLMMDYAQAGAGILQARCLELAAKGSVPVRVLSSYGASEGTLLEPGDVERLEAGVVQGVANRAGYGLLRFSGLSDRPGLVSYCLAAFESLGLGAAEVVQFGVVGDCRELVIATQNCLGGESLSELERVAGELGCEGFIVQDDLVKLTMVGYGLTGRSGIFREACSLLSKEGIDPISVSAGVSRIEFLLDSECAVRAARGLHDRFVINA